MKLKLLLAAIATFTAFNAPLQAMTLSNEDGTTHEIAIIEGQGDGDARVIELQPGAVLKDLCSASCIIQLNGEFEMEFYGDETVRIKNNDFTIDE